jgi:N-acetylglucosaminyldiphosphoundecaprenol N-acetyl-beta-D-mannosaminyltransferase
MKENYLLGLPVSLGISESKFMEWFKQALENDGGLVTFVNPTAWAIAKKQPRYRSNLLRFDCILPDGIAVVLAGLLLDKPSMERISFDSTSIAPKVFEHCRDNSIRVALIGGKPGVANRAAEILHNEIGLSTISYVSHGFFDDIRRVSAELLASQAQVVICGMGVPRQEELLVRLRDVGWRGVGFTCGGYLDQLAGGMRYYPEWINRLHLRLPYRFFREPRRLWRRYALEYPVFFAALLRAWLTRT